LLTLLFWAVVIARSFLAIRAFVRSQRRAGNGYSGVYNGPAAPVESGALAILKERYARGEITSDRYKDLRADLIT
jgi:uncharacterized membrane protein